MNTTITIANHELLGDVCALLAEGKRVKIRAKGNSMRPFIRGGDIIVLAPTPEQLRKGDIVLARLDERNYVVHRIVGIDSDRLILAGDANLFGRETCHTSQVGGIAVATLRRDRKRSLITIGSRIAAFGWLSLRPLRRLRQRVIDRFIYY